MPIRTRLSVLLVAATLALAGCGMLDVDSGPKDDVSGMSGSELLEEAQRKVKEAKFFKVKGKVAARGVTSKYHMEFASNSASGVIVEDGLKYELLNAGGNLYLRASAKVYRSIGTKDERMVALLGGRWRLVLPRDKALRKFASRVTRAGAFSPPHGRVVKGVEKTIWGVDCVSVQGKDGAIYLAKSDGRPLLVRTDTVTITFSYVKVKEVKAPAKRDVVDLSKH